MTSGRCFAIINAILKKGVYKMKNIFERAVLEIIEISAADVISTSNNGGDIELPRDPLND